MPKKILMKHVYGFIMIAHMICTITTPAISGTTYETYDNPVVYQNENVQSEEDAEEKVDQSTLHSKMFFQGKFGFSLGSTKSIEITPIIGARLTDKINIGVGVTYEYLWHDDFDSHIYGGEVFTEYKLFKDFYAKADYKYRVYNDYYKGAKYSSKSVPYLFLGGGYRPRIASGVAFQIEILYDVIQDDFSQYNDNEPIISAGVIFGF